jgi:hypothetical protein
MLESDLFTVLSRWAHRQGENFTTDSFVFVVNELLNREPLAARSLLRWLCFGKEQTSAFVSGDVQVRTQQRFFEGIPDIVVRATDIYVLIEVKKGSDLHRGQLQQYYDLLARRVEATKRLVLLTAIEATFEEHEQPNLWWRWQDVDDWFRDNPVSEPAARFLVQQFCRFLRSQTMAIDKVDWPYVEGTKALFNLLNMLRSALYDLKIPITPSRSWSTPGFYLDGTMYWVGIYPDNPAIVQFEFSDAKANDDRFRELGVGEISSDGKHVFRIDLSSEAVHFFALTKDGQFDRLRQFVATSRANAQSCRIV